MFVGARLWRPVGYRRHSMCREKTNMPPTILVISAADCAIEEATDQTGQRTKMFPIKITRAGAAPAQLRLWFISIFRDAGEV